jgi:flagellar biosynthesis protein FlhF
MNLKRFTARTSRDALALVRQAFGDDAVVMSTKSSAEGVEVLAMAPESVLQVERLGAELPPARAAASTAAREKTVAGAASRGAERPAPAPDASVEQDVEQLQMSTLSFQDYVRQRMLRRRRSELAAEAPVAEPQWPAPPAAAAAAPIEAARSRQGAVPQTVPVLREEMPTALPGAAAASSPALALRGESIEMLSELRSMRGLIEQRFGALAFMEKLQRQPRQAMLAQQLLDAGFSPALVRKLLESLPADIDGSSWAAQVLERNLHTAERDSALEDAGGVYALIGATGVGKTTSTAKLAAAFATQHGAANLGLVTLDAYRVAAHEQLRAYGRILGVPVHTAHDRASLEDLLDLLSGKRLVLIDTAGMAQRDSRTRELLEMVSHRAIQRLLVINASAQGETIEDQLAAYAAPSCSGVILSKLDESVKLAPALDAMIRHKLKVVAVANGQRVPEDWHRLSASALVQTALKGGGSAAWRLDRDDVNLIFAGARVPAAELAAHA